jgi:hypothetical protein
VCERPFVYAAVAIVVYEFAKRWDVRIAREVRSGLGREVGASVRGSQMPIDERIHQGGCVLARGAGRTSQLGNELWVVCELALAWGVRIASGSGLVADVECGVSGQFTLIAFGSERRPW